MTFLKQTSLRPVSGVGNPQSKATLTLDGLNDTATLHEPGQGHDTSLENHHGNHYPEWHHAVDRPELGISIFETTVVLLVVGIGCGLFFKGREIMDHAQAAALMDRVSEVKAAWYAFNDRFSATPGDSAPNGNGNGQIDTAVESANLWSHLLQAGYLTQVAIESGGVCPESSCVSNGYGGYMKINWDGEHHQLHAGEGIPARILAALDARYDDGLPLSGQVQVAHMNQCQVGGYYQPSSGKCDAVFRWL